MNNLYCLRCETSLQREMFVALLIDFGARSNRSPSHCPSGEEHVFAEMDNSWKDRRDALIREERIAQNLCPFCGRDPEPDPNTGEPWCCQDNANAWAGTETPHV